MKKLNLAFIGLGWATMNIWLPRFSNDNRFKIISVYDINLKSIESVVKNYPEVSSAHNMEQIATQKPDLVIIATPNITHADYAVYFLERGISVFIEKPVCLNLSQYQQLYISASKTVGRLLISQAARLRADVCSLFDAIDQEKIGVIYALELSWLRTAGIPNVNSWFSRKSWGGGVGYDLGWHVLDVGLSCIGFPNVKNGIGISFQNYIIGDHHLDRQAAWKKAKPSNCINLIEGIDAEDHLLGLLQMENNVGVTVNVAWAANVARDETTIKIHGKNASLSLLTTFGFSPNKVESSQLVLHRSNCSINLEVNKEKIGHEYSKQIELIWRNMSGNTYSNELILQQIHTIVVALEKLYLQTG